jgi:glycine cleavage system H protein
MTTADLKFSEEHEWVRTESDEVVVIGISQYAADELGDVVFVELPDVDSSVAQFGKFGEIESVKAVSDLFSPVSGTVVDTNGGVVDSPELVNESPYESGWLMKVAISDAAEIDKLMSSDEYEAFLASKDS